MRGTKAAWTVAAIVCAACGGGVDETGHGSNSGNPPATPAPPPADEATDPGDTPPPPPPPPAPPSGGTWGQSAGGRAVLTLDANACMPHGNLVDWFVWDIAGSSHDDVWWLIYGGICHWNGAAWTWRSLPDPLDFGHEDSSDTEIAAAGAGAVWIANHYGVVRMHADGRYEDFSSMFVSPFADHAIEVQASSGFALVQTQGQASLWTPATGFAPAPELDDAAILRAPDDAWRFSMSSEWERFDGARWTTVGQDPMLVWAIDPRGNALLADQPDELWHVASAAGVRPDWARKQPPYGEVVVTPWELRQVRASGVETWQPQPPPEVPQDGSVDYRGIGIARAASGGLVLFGQTVTRDYHYTVRVQETAVDGPMIVGTDVLTEDRCFADWSALRPLLDGEWLIGCQGSAEALVVTP